MIGNRGFRLEKVPQNAEELHIIEAGTDLCGSRSAPLSLAILHSCTPVFHRTVSKSAATISQ
jgi:hypothetical protein